MIQILLEQADGSPYRPASFAIVWRDPDGRLRTAGTLTPADAFELAGEATSKLPPDVLARLLPHLMALFAGRK